ncbi:hypothetical protein [Pseudonocardia sp. N23]|uniref:hypothetical protein n=1 Tax=Pseudonocardia sp. N23 TaxID=1987376 RepID=UPI000BFD180C|nr:hypothetical protein [Pseudonocardia sp. N23]GAY12057.1 hypothetical protein TOK_0447 [Pseudonocardia sp. N23]
MADTTHAITVAPELLVYAFRYALGRRTYAVADVTQALREHRAALSVQTRRQVADEIRDAIRAGHAGSITDADEWDAVATFLEEATDA